MTMRLQTHRRADFAFALLELMIVAAVAVLLFLWFLPATTGNKAKAGRIACVNNLKQVGLSFRLWAGDHGEKFPMLVTAADGGAMEQASLGVVAPVFSVMSNELSTPKILVCPDDKGRIATNFTMLGHANLSYFVCSNATNQASPYKWLSGDRNVTNGSPLIRGVLHVPTNSPASWTKKIHNQQGNLTFADGSVQQMTSQKLRDSLRSQTDSPLRLAIPK